MSSKFIVIAGPNGAGKSTTSQKILAPFEIEAFDWDKQFQSKWKSFDFDPAIVEGIRSSVNVEFQDHLRHAFSYDKSVAYETNFHSGYNLELAKKRHLLIDALIYREVLICIRFRTEHTNEEAIDGVTPGVIGLNESVTWKVKHFGVYQTLTTRITEFDSPNFFVDEMTKGAFKGFRHEHHFKTVRTLMTDRFDYQSPLGIIGKLADMIVLKQIFFQKIP